MNLLAEIVLSAAKPLKSVKEELTEYELLRFCSNVMRLVTGSIDLPNPICRSEPMFNDGSIFILALSKSASPDSV